MMIYRPFSGAEDPDLPKDVLEKTEKEREVFVAVFNATYNRCEAQGDERDDCEGLAFAVAYTAMNRL